MKLIKGFEFFTLNETTSFGACFGFNCIFLREMLGLQSFAVFKGLYARRNWNCILKESETKKQLIFH